MVKRYCLISLPLLFMLFIFPKEASSQNITAAELKKLSIEDLMNIEIISVSKRPEILADAASAIQVITREDILRSAATSIPEALRLVPNLQVTQLNSHHWTISSRGFNSVFSNKLLVMIDGRTVYSPLFAGVFWDAQNVLLNDVDRIEVISGPGGSIWGANAVNGVINIITKGSAATQGLYASASVGTELRNLLEARYGGKIGNKSTYRIYGQHRDRSPTLLPNGNDNADKWGLTQGGFQADLNPSDKNNLSLQGNFYSGVEHTAPTASSMDGQNVMGRWVHLFKDRSAITVQGYFDRTWRKDVPGTIDDELETYDLDIQHNFTPGKIHNIVWGLGYRLMDDETWNRIILVGFVPADRKMSLFSSFIQDEIALIPQRLKFIAGAKLQHTDFSGFELQPSVRIAWNPGERHTLWSAVSRAVRAPSRIDKDYHLPTYPVPPNLPSVAGGPDFISEKVIAYELGYRVQASGNLYISLATFYNHYDDLYTVQARPGTQTYQITNGAEGHSRGVELSGNVEIIPKWRIRGGYTYFKKNLRNKPGNLNDPIVLTGLGSDAENQVVLQSMTDLPGNLKLDVTSRYVDSLPLTQFGPQVSSYFNFDARIAWQVKDFEFSVSGQNINRNKHVEIGNNQIEQGFFGKIVWRH